MIPNIAGYNQGNTRHFSGGTWKNQQMMALDFQSKCHSQSGQGQIRVNGGTSMYAGLIANTTCTSTTSVPLPDKKGRVTI
jgi:hypothetical protein